LAVLGLWSEELFAAKLMLDKYPVSKETFVSTVNSEANQAFPETIRLIEKDFSSIQSSQSGKHLVGTLRDLLFQRSRQYVVKKNQPSQAITAKNRFDREEVLLCLLSIVFHTAEPSQFEDCGNSLVIDLSDLKRIVKQVFHTYDNVFGLKENVIDPNTHTRSREALNHIAKYLVGESSLNSIQDNLHDNYLNPKFEIFLKIIQNAQK
jgi:hypothetical protein